MYLLAPFILQNFEKIVRDDPKLWGCATFGPKMAPLSWTKVFWFKPLPLLSSTSWLFSLCKIQKNSYSRSRVMRMHIFWPKMVHLPQTHFVLENYYHSHLPVSHFHCKIFKKKFFQRIQSYKDVQFLDPKWPISPNEIFFRKPVNEPCFFHSCLSTCQKSKSDINLLVKYWWLKNTEISLDESHFCL